MARSAGCCRRSAGRDARPDAQWPPCPDVDGSTDEATAKAARLAGAEVHREADLLPEFGPVLGKGDATPNVSGRQEMLENIFNRYIR